MRIAITNHHRNLVGGTESYLNGIIPELEARGHEVMLFHEAGVNDAPVIQASQHSQDWAKLASFRKNVIFNQGLVSPEREHGLADLAPVVHFAHNYHGTCISGQKTRKIPSASPCPRQFGPVCLLEYLPRNCGGWSPLIAIRDYRVQSGRLQAMKRAALVITASAHMEAEYRRHEMRAVQTIPLFVSQKSTALPEISQNPFRILFAGRMTKIKGADLLARSIPLIKKQLGCSVEVTFAGSGPEKSHIQQLCPYASFPGWVSQTELQALASTHHMFAMPSIWPEPFGLAALELGLPAVAFAVGGIPDWLQDGVNGALASAHSLTPEAFAEAVVRCSRIPHARTNMHQSARKFTLAGHMEQLIPILESVSQ